MADSNAPEVQDLAEQDKEKRQVLEELRKMSQNREELMSMFADKYAEINRNSELEQYQEIGMAQGMAQGMAIQLIVLVKKKLAKNISANEISQMLEVEQSYVEQIGELIRSNPEITDKEIAEKLSCNNN